ncbi:metal ABC transporter substrate-binding protein [Prosthecomicrobium hirschii]|uniref:metal ABC transporter substrate-binding protein n=1 Tax=Prosthecodimorpha hirschii TaxID=665126 RepID=UPI00221FA240|nr:metal ABC transporter substrate-binding protein [Prosthecomicrobium hirschii]MCW1843309.1 metal ABC transporter substrate-binding protein [Prosthecomicrobium hirschii]
MTGIVRRSVLGAAASLAAALVVLPLGAGPTRAADPIPVVATFSILGDFVRQVGGDRVAVKILVGPNGDAHVYNPTPADAKSVAGAKVVFVNGLGFEGWMQRLVKASGTKAPLVTATTGITPREMADEDDDHDHDPKAKGKGKDAHAGHDHGATDPHAWQSVANAKVYIANVRDGLIAADPDGKATYEANAGAYLAKLDALEADVKAAIDKIPATERRVLTSHDAFGYFSGAYGITFLAPQGISTEAEATAKDVAKLIRQIKKEKVKAVFVENMTDGRIVERIAKETGIRLGGSIFSDSLSPETGPAATYIDMVRHNVKLLTAAMAGA